MSSINQELKNNDFATVLASYKEKIDEDIARYSKELEAQTYEEFGQYPLEAVKVFTSILSRGGKRIRGALTMYSYELFGGNDPSVALKAARAVEMLQAYILMADDIQDRSDTRRSGPTAHQMIASYHRDHHFSDGAEHFGESIAINGFLIGLHSAMSSMTTLNVSPDICLKAIKNINDCYVATAHGQTLDIFNEVVGGVEEKAIDNVLIWKTAFYTFVNPLQFGAILAGADEASLQTLYNYSIPAGRLFQITDDIIGTFSEESEMGKSPFDDIKEGKRTLLTIKAIELASKADSYFLQSCLGKHDLTSAEFERCREIIEASGALAYAKQQALLAADKAKTALAGATISREKLLFLEQLVDFLVTRKK